MNDLKIIKATKKDIPEILRINRKCILAISDEFYPKNIRERWAADMTGETVECQLDTSEWYILALDGKTIGFCQFDIETGELYEEFVDPDYQGKGYGKFIYKFIERHLIENKVFSISCFSALNSQKFYESLSFKFVKFIEFDLSGVKMKMAEMRKILN